MEENTITIARIEFFDRPNHSSIFEFRYLENDFFGMGSYYYFKTVEFKQDGYGPYPLEYGNHHNRHQSIEGAIAEMLVRFRQTNFRLCGLTSIGQFSLNSDKLPSDYFNMVNEFASIFDFNPYDVKDHQVKALEVDWAVGKMKFSDDRISSDVFELELKKRMDQLENHDLKNENLDFYLDKVAKEHFENEYQSQMI